MRLAAARLLCIALLALLSCTPRRENGGATRVVSLSPSTTEAIFAIGAGDLLVGRSQHCDHPDQAKRLPSVGGYADPDVERVLALRPTLVIGEQSPAGPALEERLRGHGVATLFPPTRTIGEIGDMLAALGNRVGRAEEGRKAQRQLDERIARLRRWAAKRKPVRVVLVFDARPLFVAGPGGFADEVLRLAGATNAVDAGGAYPTIDVERLLVLDPDVILDAVDVEQTGPSKLAQAEGWSRLRAVKAGRVRRITSSAALRPGPRIAEGIAEVARAIHGETPNALE